RGQQHEERLLARPLRQVIQRHRIAVVDDGVVAEGLQWRLQREALRNTALDRGGGFALRFGRAEGEPARATELTTYGDAHEAFLRQIVGIQAQVDVAHYRWSIIDLAMRGQDA